MVDPDASEESASEDMAVLLQEAQGVAAPRSMLHISAAPAPTGAEGQGSALAYHHIVIHTTGRDASRPRECLPCGSLRGGQDAPQIRCGIAACVAEP